MAQQNKGILLLEDLFVCDAGKVRLRVPKYLDNCRSVFNREMWKAWRVGSREERQCHIEFAGPHLLHELLPEISTQHRLKSGEATREALDRRDEARLRERM